MSQPNSSLPQPFNPPSRLLMGPGPSDVHPRVLAAMARPTVGHLDPSFVGLMDELKLLLRQVLRTDNALTIPVSGPGSVGMEACFVNLVEPGDKDRIALLTFVLVPVEDAVHGVAVMEAMDIAAAEGGGFKLF